MKPRIRRRFVPKQNSIGFQIAPMIDVVFVILLFFMVAAGQAKNERAHNTRLPSCCTGAAPLSMPDEIIITIERDGQVLLNDDPVDGAGVANLTELSANLVSLKTATDAAGESLMVTIVADELSKYERMVNVLDALVVAKISKVTFSTGNDQ